MENKHNDKVRVYARMHVCLYVCICMHACVYMYMYACIHRKTSLLLAITNGLHLWHWKNNMMYGRDSRNTTLPRMAPSPYNQPTTPMSNYYQFPLHVLDRPSAAARHDNDDHIHKKQCYKHSHHQPHPHHNNMRMMIKHSWHHLSNVTRIWLHPLLRQQVFPYYTSCQSMTWSSLRSWHSFHTTQCVSSGHFLTHIVFLSFHLNNKSESE